MKYFMTEWDKLFVIRVLALATLDDKMIATQNSDVI